MTTGGSLSVDDFDVTDTTSTVVDSVAVSGTGMGSVPGSLTNAILQGFLTVDVGNVIDNVSITGEINWAFDNGSEAFDFLATGETLILDYTIIATDAPTGASDTQAVTITGTNDTPIASDDTATAVESGGIANWTSGTDPSGNVLANDTDVDFEDTKAIDGVAAGSQPSASGSVGTAVVGNFGLITINSDGSYSYALDNNNAAVQTLRTSSDTIQDVFTYTMIDTDGASATTEVTITIRGQNDTPIAVADTVTAVEAGGIANGSSGAAPTGNVLGNDTDVDSGDTETVTGVAAGVVGTASGSVGSSVVGSYGSISIASDGSYSYTVDNNNATVEALRTAADTIDDVFTYTMIDASGASATVQITVTIQGANNAPMTSM